MEFAALASQTAQHSVIPEGAPLVFLDHGEGFGALPGGLAFTVLKGVSSSGSPPSWLIALHPVHFPHICLNSPWHYKHQNGPH